MLQQPVCGRQNNLSPTKTTGGTALHALDEDVFLPVQTGGWVLEYGIWRANPRERLRLAARRQPERMGMRESANDTYGETWAAAETKHRCWVRSKGRDHCGLSPHASAPTSLGTKKSSRWGGCSCTPSCGSHFSAPHPLRGRCYHDLDHCHLRASSLLGQTHGLRDRLKSRTLWVAWK